MSQATRNRIVRRCIAWGGISVGASVAIACAFVGGLGWEPGQVTVTILGHRLGIGMMITGFLAGALLGAVPGVLLDLLVGAIRAEFER